MTIPANRRRTAHYTRATAAVVALLLLASACTASSDPKPDTTGTPPATTTTPPAPAPTPSPTPSPTPRINPAAIEFTYQAPDPVCVPVDELSLPGADQHDYHTDSSLIESYNIRIGCVYELDTIVDVDHVRIYIRTSVFPHRDDASAAGLIPDIPVDADDLNEWGVAVMFTRTIQPWTEDCPSGPSCGDDENFTTNFVAHESSLGGTIGNLVIEALIHHITHDPSDDAFVTNLESFRTYVLAELDRREHTIHDW